jgi:hypothetical protein
MFLSGKHDGYFWCESTSACLTDFLESFQDYFDGRWIAVTAFDSGPLKVSEDQRTRGWRSRGRVVLIPPSSGLPPVDGWDEWYLFADAPALEQFKEIEVFVNYSEFGFTPFPTKFRTRQSDAGIAAMHRCFWSQIGRLDPETFVADGDRLVVVTKDHNVFEQVAAACHKADSE